jgi:hypothetical protein
MTTGASGDALGIPAENRANFGARASRAHGGAAARRTLLRSECAKTPRKPYLVGDKTKYLDGYSIWW